MEVLFPNVSADFLDTVSTLRIPLCLLFEEELSSPAVRRGNATVPDSDTLVVLMESDVFAASDCDDICFLSHVFIMDNPIELVFFGQPPPPVAGFSKRKFSSFGCCWLLSMFWLLLHEVPKPFVFQ